MQVLNTHLMRNPGQANTISIMRPGKWGNPFVIGRDGDRDEVIKKYKTYILENKKLLGDLNELLGKDLVCCCKPKRCHGDVLVELVQARFGG